MPEVNLDSTGNLLLGLAVYLGLVAAAFWLAMVVWTYRDMKARSRDRVAQLLVTLMVAVLYLPGLLIYLFLRPRETLSEAYERSLEEEALLQDIEEKPTCPGCKSRVKEDWQVCPACHTRLKKQCMRCANMLELAWTVCPTCAMPQTAYNEQRQPAYARPAAAEDWQAGGYESAGPVARTGQQLEFIDGEE